MYVSWWCKVYIKEMKYFEIEAFKNVLGKYPVSHFFQFFSYLFENLSVRLQLSTCLTDRYHQVIMEQAPGIAM